MSTDIRTIIRRLASPEGGTPTILVCAVTAVDTEARTVDVEPINEDAPILSVNLQANQGSRAGVVQYPRLGSHVVVGMLEGYDAGCVLLAEDVERIEVDVDGTTLQVDADGIEMNGGTLGGLVKVGALTGRLNRIERDINNLKQAVAAWIPAPQDGGAALKGILSGWAGSPLAETTEADCENKKIRQ